jgi:hypothetical protein
MPSEPNLPKFVLEGVTIYDATPWFPTRTGASGVVFRNRDREMVDMFAVHHDAVAFSGEDLNFNGTTVDEERARMQASYNWHTKFRDNPAGFVADGSQGWNWPGMGYHMYVFPSGRIYEVGRLSTVRAHVAHRNTRSIGCVVAGDFTARPPAIGGILAAGAVLLYCWGWRGRIIEPRGHRQWAVPGWETSCPGNAYQRWVPQVLEIAARLAQERSGVSPDTRIRAALQGAWDGSDWGFLHQQLHYIEMA